LCFPNDYCAVSLVPTSSGFLARLDSEIVGGKTDGDGWEESQWKRRRGAQDSMIDLTGDLNGTTSSFGSPVSGSTSCDLIKAFTLEMFSYSTPIES
jgi:hypothetical protein